MSCISPLVMGALKSFLVLFVFFACVHGTLSIWGGRKPPPKVPAFCNNPPFYGPCQPITKNWYFNVAAKSCLPTSAGLCCVAGNNCFIRKDKCSEMCERQRKLLSSKVALPQMCVSSPTFIHCGQLRSAWYYDSFTGNCKMFTFNVSSCGTERTEANIFLSELKCQSTCIPKRKPRPMCSEDPVPDTCFLHRKHWHFDFRNNECIRFPKKGCGKGSNSFSTVEKCMMRCSLDQVKLFLQTCAGAQEHKVHPSLAHPRHPTFQAEPVLWLTDSPGILAFLHTVCLPVGAHPALPASKRKDNPHCRILQV
nr:papilin-like [Rhipicephalus microplus]